MTMNEKLECILFERYPLLFARYATKPPGYSHLQCGDGWFDLIDSLCEVLQRSVTSHRPPHPQPAAVQVKEKFGGLRFYIHGGDQYQHGLIDMAEEMSFRICEICGSPGRMLIDDRNWSMARCAAHAPANAKPAETETPKQIDGIHFRFQPEVKAAEKCAQQHALTHRSRSEFLAAYPLLLLHPRMAANVSIAFPRSARPIIERMASRMELELTRLVEDGLPLEKLPVVTRVAVLDKSLIVDIKAGTLPDEAAAEFEQAIAEAVVALGSA